MIPRRPDGIEVGCDGRSEQDDGSGPQLGSKSIVDCVRRKSRKLFRQSYRAGDGAGYFHSKYSPIKVKVGIIV